MQIRGVNVPFLFKGKNVEDIFLLSFSSSSLRKSEYLLGLPCSSIIGLFWQAGCSSDFEFLIVTILVLCKHDNAQNPEKYEKCIYPFLCLFYLDLKEWLAFGFKLALIPVIIY